MNNQEALGFIRHFFDELYGKHNVDALDDFLDVNYFDDDIGDPEADHIQNSKDYLCRIFQANPTIAVDVKDAMTHDNVITAFLEYFVSEDGMKKIVRKGVAIFVIEKDRIVRRHSFIYDEGK